MLYLFGWNLQQWAIARAWCRQDVPPNPDGAKKVRYSWNRPYDPGNSPIVEEKPSPKDLEWADDMFTNSAESYPWMNRD